MSVPFFVIAIIALMAAHVVRTVRWRILLSGCNVHVSNVRPLTALSVGYLFNTILPLRLGELVRTWLLSHTTRSRFGTVLGTVVVERLADLFAVGLIMACFIGYQVNLGAAIWTLSLALMLLLIFYAIRSSTRARRSMWLLASVFNEEIKAAVLHFCFVVVDLLFTRPVLRSARFWGLTVVMWALYLSSLVLFARACGNDVIASFSSVYMHTMNVRSLLSLNYQDAWLVAYLTIPIPLILIYAYLSGFNALSGLKGALRSITRIERYASSHALSRSHGFRSEDQYHAFLDRYFRGQGGLLSEFEQRGINEVQLHRVFHGGSGAITALIEVDGRLRVRKFASGSLAGKLAVQRDWLDAHRERLPLVGVLETHSTGGDYFYDMNFLGGSRDLYEGIHTDPVANSIQLLDDVLEKVSAFHLISQVQSADDVVVGAYVDAKVFANFSLIEREFEDIFELGQIDLNGEPFNLSRLSVLKDRAWFLSKLRDRRQSSIHGDLTIENIMLDTSARSGPSWFLIDPNPDNGFQSPLIDFAKLMQSLHLGYEALHKAPRATLSGNRLSVGLHRSSQYESIHAHVVVELTTRFGSDVVKEIYLHEWINYLRLIPYQLRMNREAGLAFFGCLCMLIRDFDQAYPGEIAP